MDTREHRDDNLQDQHDPEAGRRAGHVEESDTQHHQHGIHEYKGGLLTHHLGNRHTEGHTSHVRHLSNTQEQTGIEEEYDAEERQTHVGTDDVEEEIGHRSTTHGVKQVRAEGGSDQYPPGPVVEQRLEVATHTHRRDTFQMLPCQDEADDEHHETGSRQLTYSHPGRLSAVPR